MHSLRTVEYEIIMIKFFPLSDIFLNNYLYILCSPPLIHSTQIAKDCAYNEYVNDKQKNKIA